MSIRIVALDSALVKRLQNGGLDANGHKPERHICEGGGRMPCRHCLTDIKAGEPYLILAHRPFGSVQPYAEQGPIFLHAESCARHPDSADVPAMFLEREGYLIRGYGADDRIVYGTGKIVAPAVMVEAAQDMFANSRVTYIHVRSASNNCYQARIDRA
jgi:Protein of unknown function (DUF1203)